jgi:alanine racemase
MKGQRTVAEINLRQLARNFSILSDYAKRHYQEWKGAVPMVKCNAYGHGIVETAKALKAHAETLGFGVATLDEAIALRGAGIRKPIWVFSECTPFSEEIAKAVLKYRLTPILHSVEDVKVLLKLYRRARLRDLKFHLKFNTGLNRLGIDMSDLQVTRKLLRETGLMPEGICSHLATSENPRSEITRRQVRRFTEVVKDFSAFEASYIHCSNSGGTFSEPALSLGEFCNVIRPGIGLYGYGGRVGARLGLKPVLKWRAQVVRARVLKAGECVGYGATYCAKQKTEQAVIGVGYGDGLHRSLSNQKIRLGQRDVAVLGRVSMDLTSISLKAKPGSWVTLLGESETQGIQMADAAGTIIYEVLTSISARVPRSYAMG